MERPGPILVIAALWGLVIVSQLAAQNAPNSASPKDEAQGTPAVLACPSTNEPLQDDVTFNWKPGSRTETYRLLLGPTPGANRDGDSGIITGLQGQLSGLPPGQNLYVTLWSYDSTGKPVQPPSFCFIKTAPGTSVTAYKDFPQTGLTGVSLGSVALDQTVGTAGAAQVCQQRCTLNAACHGYTYFPAANGNSAACDLKSQITASYRSECCASAVKAAMADAVPEPVSQEALVPAAPSIADSPAPRPAPAPTSESVAAAPIPISSAPVAPPPSTPAPTASASAAPKSVPPSAGIAGDWVNQFGAVSTLVQRGAAISGSYSDAKDPSLSGAFKGTFDGKTFRAALTWKSGDDSSHGNLVLTLTSDGRLVGTWTDANGASGPWTMARHQ